MKFAVKAALSVAVLLVIGVVCVYTGPHKADANILINIRLPRVLSALLVGACLSGGGVLSQGVLRNPLADPYIMGTSAGAAFGLVLCSLFRVQYSSILYYLIITACSFGAVLTAYLLSRVKNSTQLVSLLLSGIMVNTFLSAALLAFFVFRREQSFSVMMFMMGTVREATVHLQAAGIIALALSCILSVYLSKKLDIMSLGELKSSHLGINTETSRMAALFTSALLTSVAVALGGIVSFVGLIVPHVVRMVFGPKHGVLFFMSVIWGAGFLAVADTFCRTAFSPVELPIGIVTSLAGVPFFIWLLRRHNTAGQND